MRKHKKKELEKFADLSRKKGLKLTPQRMVIFRILSESGKHLCADEIYQKAKKEYPMLSATTIYRNLESMVSAGLLSHLRVGGTAVRYDTNLDDHHHFVCNKCRKVQDIYLTDVKYELNTEKSLIGKAKIDSSELFLRGVCEDCL